MVNLCFSNSTLPILMPFWAYVIAYVSIVLTVVFVLLAITPTKKKKWNDAALANFFAKNHLSKYLFLAAILCMAGLPPFHFFIFKVGVLSYIVNIGAFGAFACILLLLFISWYAYQAIVIRLIPNFNVASKWAYNKFSIWELNFFFVFLMFTLLGFFFVEELFFLSSWFFLN